MSPKPTIYTHPSPLSTLLPHLLPLLPSPLPLIRRLQSHLQTPSAHPLATFPPTPSPPAHPFALAYLDRSRAPETECWLYSSVELASHPSSSDPALARAQILALLAHVARLPLPAGYDGPGPAWLHVGALHQGVLELVKGAGFEEGAAGGEARREWGPWTPDALWSGEGGVLRCHTVGWRKFVVAPGAGAGAETGGLEEGLAFGRVGSRRGDWERVMERLVLPRREQTLRALPGVAVRRVVGDGDGDGEGEMVAWGFWGLDGSVTSLHVEEEVRGKGLGKAVTARLLQMLVAGEWEEGEDGEKRNWKGFVGLKKEQAWAHMDVGEKNAASIAVAKGLGGTEAWLVFWTWMDLENAVKELNQMSGGSN